MVCDEGADAMLDRSDTPGYNRSADAEDEDDEEVDEPEDKDKPELSTTAPSTLSAAVLPNPLYFEVVRSGATRHKTAVRPLLAMWARARRLLVCITPVLRHECEVLHTRGVTTAFAEVRHRSRKNVDNTAPVTAARRTVESDLRNLLETHSAQESAILADWADASGPLSARSESQLRAAMEKQERAQSHHEEVERLRAALRALQGVPPSDTTAGLRSSAASAAARKAGRRAAPCGDCVGLLKAARRCESCIASHAEQRGCAWMRRGGRADTRRRDGRGRRGGGCGGCGAVKRGGLVQGGGSGAAQDRIGCDGGSAPGEDACIACAPACRRKRGCRRCRGRGESGARGQRASLRCCGTPAFASGGAVRRLPSALHRRWMPARRMQRRVLPLADGTKRCGCVCYAHG